MADTFDPTALQVVPAAVGKTRGGAPKPLTPLQRKTEQTALGAPTNFPEGLQAAPSLMQTTETPQETARLEAEYAALAAERSATPIADAFEATVGGYARDAYRLASQKEGAREVDPNWDVGAVRENFRLTYPRNQWDALEATRNKDQYDVLVGRLEDKAKREAIQAKSFIGTAGGLIADPTNLVGLGVLKGAIGITRAYRLGKTAALAGGASAEGAIYGGFEGGIQRKEFGRVYDPGAVATTVVAAAALHYGLGHLTTSKALYEKGGKVPPVRSPAGDLAEDHPSVTLEGESLIAQAQRELSDHAQARVDAYDSPNAEGSRGFRFEPEEPRTFAESSYPVLKEEVGPDDALVSAGAAANTSRAVATEGNIIESLSDPVNDAAELYTLADKANREALGEHAYEWLQTPLGKVQALFSNTLRGLSSSSPIVRAVAQTLGADGTGITRAVERATAYDKAIYNNQMRGHYAKEHDEYLAWLKRTGRGGYIAEATGRHEEEWNLLVRREMETRWNTKDLDPAAMEALDEARWARTDPEVKRAADARDAGNQVALDHMKRHSVLGADVLSDVSRGYVPRRADGKKWQALHRTDPTKYAKLVDALGARYFKGFTDSQRALIAGGAAGVKLITRKKAQTIAEGTITRAINRASGKDGTTIGLFDRAARDEIKSILEAAGSDYADIKHTFDLLDKKLGKSTGSNRLKGRMSVDIATPLDDGSSLIDYFDNDLNRLTYSYAEEMSGRIALARQGIGSDTDFEHILEAVKNENKSLDPEKDIQLLRDMHSVLLGRPLEGQGRNKFLQFLLQLNPWQTLGQVGAAQGTESSLSAARMGIGAALKAIPVAAKLVVGARHNLLNESDKQLLKGIEAWMGPVGELWRTHRPSTDVMERLNADGQVSHMADRLLKAGQHVNGFVSLMHQIMEAQLKIVAIEGTRTFAKEIKAGVLTKRIADAGWNEHSLAAVHREMYGTAANEFKDGKAVFKDGELYDLQLHNWDAGNADDFIRNLERLSGQLIQRDYAGETASWMHKDMGRMLLSLRGYSMKAFNKQLVRNVHIGDATAALSVVYGLAFSTLGYTAKAHLMAQGREDAEEFLESRMSGDAFIQGAVGYMALGAFAPEVVRPLASWYSEGSNEAGAVRSGGNAIVALIPGLAPLARVITDADNIGGATLGDRDFGTKQVRHLVQTTLGNSFPVALAINAATDDSE